MARILYIEDDAATREIKQELFESYGHFARHAGSPDPVYAARDVTIHQFTF